ncbi:MAG: type VI secretion system lipoprotein TssJ [Paracoccaceae bacterium]
MRQVHRRFAITGLLATAVSACAPPPPAAPIPPTTVALTITGDMDMNGRRPAKVKIYYLASPARFGLADFFALFDQAEATLGADLLGSDEFSLGPGRVVTDAKEFATPPAAIGIVAGFREVGGPGWRAITPLTPNAPNPVQVTLSGNTVIVGK